MKERIFDRTRLLPPGLEPEWEREGMIWSLVFMVLVSAVGYFGRLESGISSLYKINNWGERILWPNAVMKPFYQLLPEMWVFFGAVALAFGLGLGHWLYCRQESRADYRLRLLPDRWEYLRRCLALPLLYLAAAAACALVLAVIYYGVYLLRVPDQCLEPDQWGIFVDALLGRRQ